MNNPSSIMLALNDAALFCVGIGTLLLLYLAFKVTKFAMKLILLLATLAILSGVAWWYFAGRAH